MGLEKKNNFDRIAQSMHWNIWRNISRCTFSCWYFCLSFRSKVIYKNTFLGRKVKWLSHCLKVLIWLGEICSIWLLGLHLTNLWSKSLTMNGKQMQLDSGYEKNGNRASDSHEVSTEKVYLSHFKVTPLLSVSSQWTGEISWWSKFPETQKRLFFPN